MKTNQQSDTGALLHTISNNLQVARQELDEFVVQLALGKAEAQDKFEEMKKRFLKRLLELNEAFTAESKKHEVWKKIETLEGELNAGEAVGSETFAGRVKKIFKSLETIKKEISKNIKNVQQQVDFDHEVEMFKLKLEILRLRFSLKKFEVKEDFQVYMKEAKAKIDTITSQVKEKIMSGNGKYSSFSNEVQLAYKHFRKAMETL